MLLPMLLQGNAQGCYRGMIRGCYRGMIRGLTQGAGNAILRTKNCSILVDFYIRGAQPAGHGPVYENSIRQDLVIYI